MNRAVIKSRARTFAMSAALGLACTASHRSHGFSFFQLDGINVVWPTGESVRCLSPTTFPRDSVAEQHILAAMGLWNIVPAADFEYFFNRLDQDFAIDHFDGFNDTAAVAAAELDPGIIGVTFLVNDGANWFDMDVLFSDNPLGAGYTFAANPDCEVITNPAENGFSFLLAATHELGHALGLGHDPIGSEAPGSPWFVGTMNPHYPTGGTVGAANIIELHTDDRNGLRFLYPPTSQEPPLTDFAGASYTTGGIIGQVVPVFFSPLTVFPGEEVTARSVVENFGTTSVTGLRQGFYLSTDPMVDNTDLFLGALLWDLDFQNAFQFEVIATLPPDLAAGSYHLGSILDDLDDIVEEFEDNNDVVYCEPLTVAQLVPEIDTLRQQSATCGQPFTGPVPSVTHPLNMSPITWSRDTSPPGVTVNPSTGVISWPDPIPSDFLHAIDLRATNDAGSATTTLFVNVARSSPRIDAIAEQRGSCGVAYGGPPPQLTSPDCMNPILNWSLIEGPTDMTIDAGTGVVAWLSPLPASTPHVITVRATNATGHGDATWQLQVPPGDLITDGVLNLADLPGFTTCWTGPTAGRLAGCECADADLDGHVDLADFQSIQNSFGD